MRNLDNAIPPAAVTQRETAPLHPWRGALAAVALSVRAIASRRRLAEMDDRMLADIGLSRADALREAARPPWDLAPTRDTTRLDPWR